MLKMSKSTPKKNHSSYQLKLNDKINVSVKMTEMSTCDKDFKAAIINSAQISNYEHAQNKGKKVSAKKQKVTEKK